jgi:hypothetical protein
MGTPKKRAHSLNNLCSVIEITPCRDQPRAGLLKDGDNEIGPQLGYDTSGFDLPIYWESPEAAKFFCFDCNSRDNVFLGLKERLKILTEVLQSCDGYKRVVTNSTKSLVSEQFFM